MLEPLYYTYIIGWTEHNKFYYGSRTSAKCDPLDLWVTYFTSSKYVKRFRKEFGEPDIVEIDRIFTDVKTCLLYEEMFHRYANVVKDDMWINHAFAHGEFSTANKAVAKNKDGDNIGLVSLNDSRWASGDIVHVNLGNKNEKISQLRKNKYWSTTSNQSRENNRKSALEWHSDPERNKKHRESLKKVQELNILNGNFVGEKNPMFGSDQSGENNPMYGRKHSQETRQKISKKLKGKSSKNKGVPLSEEHKEKLRRPKTEEHRQKLKESWVRRKEKKLLILWCWLLFKLNNYERL